jgi:hypothetical protein
VNETRTQEVGTIVACNIQRMIASLARNLNEIKNKAMPLCEMMGEEQLIHHVLEPFLWWQRCKLCNMMVA